VLAAAVLWGTTGTAQALGPDGTRPIAVGAARILVGGAVLLAVAALRGTLAAGRPWPLRPVLAAALAMAVYQPLFFSGVRLAGVALGTVIAIGSAPVLTGLLGLVLPPQQRPGWRWAGATGLAIVGAVLLLGPGGAGVRPAGVLLALGAGGAYACYVLATKRLLEGRPASAVTGVTFGLAAALLAPVLVFTGLGELATARGLAMSLYLGLGATALAYLLFGRGLRDLPAANAATLSLAEPMTAALLGLTVLGERLSPAGVGGLLLLVGGLALLATGPTSTAAPSGPSGSVPASPPARTGAPPRWSSRRRP
jgi:DME family drug/metabolite transporter